MVKYDLIVIGGGAGGLTVAAGAAGLGCCYSCRVAGYLDLLTRWDGQTVSNNSLYLLMLLLAGVLFLLMLGRKHLLLF